MMRRFGTVPRRFLADASNGWASLGACSVAGIGMRGIGFRSWSNWVTIDPRAKAYSLSQNSSSRWSWKSAFREMRSEIDEFEAMHALAGC